MKGSIGLIGLGWVGSSVAISILHQGICEELLINDVNTDIAEGEAMDLNHGSSFYPTSHVRAAAISEMKECRAIVITAGRGGTADESRLDLLKSNIQIARSISDELKGYEGMLIIVSNPVDVLTYYYQKFTGLPTNRVIGTGTMLDTARLRDYIGKTIGVNPKSIHASVIGEHGDSEVTLWSRANAGGVMLRDWKGWKPEFENVISDKVRMAAYEIIKRKGATNHAIGLVTATLLKWILRGEKRLVNVSSVINGPYALKDMAISLPAVISSGGVHEVIEVDMNKVEMEQLLNSADILKKAILSVAKG